MEIDGGNDVGVSDCATGVRGDQQVIGGVTVQVSKAGRGRWSQAVVLSRQAHSCLLPAAVAVRRRWALLVQLVVKAFLLARPQPPPPPSAPAAVVGCYAAAT